jgi:hypothetical protein
MTRLRAIACAVGVLLQAVALFLLAHDRALAWTLLTHLSGAFVWGYGCAALLPVAQRPLWWFTAAPAGLFPLLGPLTSLVLVLTLRLPPIDRSARRYIVWNDQTQTALADSLPAGTAGQSIVEILQSPRTQLRRNAILALRDLDPPLAIPLLRKGLQDSDEQVRIYSQNILSTMLERYESGLKELAQRVAAEPAAALHAVRLAEQYHELVYLDVAGDDETAAHYLNHAPALLARAADLAPTDQHIAFLALRCAIRARNIPSAAHSFARLQQGGYDVRQVLPWRMELVFLQGDWARLRELLVVYQRSQIVNPRIDDIVRFWHLAPTPTP